MCGTYAVPKLESNKKTNIIMQISMKLLCYYNEYLIISRPIYIANAHNVYKISPNLNNNNIQLHNIIT